MAVFKGTVPKGAVVLTEEEAASRQIALIKDWQPVEEVFFLKNGSIISGLCTLPAGAYLINVMRKAMKVGKYGKITTTVAGLAMPMCCTALLHHLSVTRDVVIHKTECSTCVGVRSGFIQCLIGGIYPAVIIPLSVATFASRLQTAILPENFRHVPSAVRKLYAPHKNIFLANLIAQFLIGFVLSELETKNTLNIYARFTRMQEDIEEKSES
ncbi:transmembrane protein 126A-like [Artemia franciscana]|uniref:transmembrane protein 126A-like n=1 Tax=Artemia franciscana TaxID=6661 RepID=UPI0032DB7D53